MDDKATTPATANPMSAGAVHRILQNSLFNIFGQAGLAVCQLVVVFVLARALGPAGFGEYYTIFALVLVTQLIVEAGIGTVLTARIARGPSDWRAHAAEGAGLFTLILLGSIATLSAIGGAWAWASGDSAPAVRFAIAGLACAAIQIERYCVAVFRAWEMVGYENLSRILQGSLFAGLVIGLAMQDLITIELALSVFAASHVISALFMMSRLWSRARGIGWRLNRAVTRDWMIEAVPLGLGDVVRRVTWQLDTILLGILQPAVVVGIYSIAYRPLGPLNWLPAAVLTAVFPSFARLGDDPQRLGTAFSHSLRLLWVLSIPLVVAISICAEPLIVLLAGPAYLEAAVPLRILIWITTLSYLSIQFRFVFTAVGRQRSFARLVIFVFLMELGIELALIPFWGYFGACAGSLIGELVFTVVGLVVCHRLGIGKIEWSALSQAVAAGAVMAAGLWLVSDLELVWLLVAVIMAGLGYLMLCMALGAIRRQEVRRFVEACSGFFRRRTRDHLPESAGLADSSRGLGDSSRGVKVVG